jgi:hypothetical protein
MMFFPLAPKLMEFERAKDTLLWTVGIALSKGLNEKQSILFAGNYLKR